MSATRVSGARAVASAPGKLMLFGGYAVLEGHPSLALCFHKRIRCVAEPSERLQLVAPGVFEPAVDLPAAFPEAAPDARLELLWPLLRRHGQGVHLEFSAEFPPVWGLGSSSASSLAAAAALAELRGDPFDGDALFAAVRDAQRSLQGQASGYDAATQLEGGYVAYAAAGRGERRRLTCPTPLNWVVAWTGIKAKTGPMVRRIQESFPRGHAIYGEIGAVAREGIERLQAGDARSLGRLMNAGHGLLGRLGAVPAELAAIAVALQADPDVLGAQLCGAGGGDCLLILAEDPTYAGRAAQQHGLQLLDLRFEEQGLRLEPSPPAP